MSNQKRAYFSTSTNNSQQNDTILSNLKIQKSLDGFSGSIYSPNRNGKKVEEREAIQVGIQSTEDEEMVDEKPRFPIRIPIEKMKPKKNYLGSTVEKQKRGGEQISGKKAAKEASEKKIMQRPHTASGASAKAQKKTQERVGRSIQSANRGQSQKALGNKIKQFSSATSGSQGFTNVMRPQDGEQKPWEIAGMIEKIIDEKMASGKLPTNQKRNFALQVKKDLHHKQFLASNGKLKTNQSHNESKMSNNSQQDKFSKTFHEAKEELCKDKEDLVTRAKRIVEENLKKYEQLMSLQKQKEAAEKEKSLERKARIETLNTEIRESNKQFKSESPHKNKYAWGADQQKFKMPPRKQSEDKSFKPIDPKVRREQIGLSKLNEVDDGELKKIKNDYKKKMNEIIVETEKKYNPSKRDLPEDEKEKRKQLIKEQKQQRIAQLQNEKKEKEQEKEKKKERLNSFLQKIKDMQKQENEEKKRNPSKKKPKKKKPFVVNSYRDPIPDPDPEQEEQPESAEREVYRSAGAPNKVRGRSESEKRNKNIASFDQKMLQESQNLDEKKDEMSATKSKQKSESIKKSINQLKETKKEPQLDVEEFNTEEQIQHGQEQMLENELREDDNLDVSDSDDNQHHDERRFEGTHENEYENEVFEEIHDEYDDQEDEAELRDFDKKLIQTPEKEGIFSLIKKQKSQGQSGAGIKKQQQNQSNQQYDAAKTQKPKQPSFRKEKENQVHSHNQQPKSKKAQSQVAQPSKQQQQGNQISSYTRKRLSSDMEKPAVNKYNKGVVKSTPLEEQPQKQIQQQDRPHQQKGGRTLQDLDFDELLFSLTSEELVKLPYFSIINK